MGEIIRLQGKRTFTLSEAQKLLPVIKRVTDEAVEFTQSLIGRARLLPKDSPKRVEIETAIHEAAEIWAAKVGRLGAEAKGLWLVDFDSGSGYFCWRHGEATISHCHGYVEGFNGRRPIVALTE